MRVCLVYDCLFPHTVGGAERWYRNLAERLTEEGHDVAYLTLRQWPRGQDPGVRGVRVVVAGPRMALYTTSGRRRILPPLVFGVGVLWHLLRHGRRYAPCTWLPSPTSRCSPRRWPDQPGRYRLFVDWHEFWTLSYWREYLGPLGGRSAGKYSVCACAFRRRHSAFHSLHARRLREQGYRGVVTVLEASTRGLSPVRPSSSRNPSPCSRVGSSRRRRPDAVPALARARGAPAGIARRVYGDGPERPRVQQQLRCTGLDRIMRLRWVR